jgi:ethanolamine ammonia-lyase small subunit
VKRPTQTTAREVDPGNAELPAEHSHHVRSTPDAGSSTTVVTQDPWSELRRLTSARLALGRVGSALPTAPHLAFQRAHAEARDAVHRALDVQTLESDLRGSGLAPLLLHSAAPDRATYLQRPDLGRRLSDESRQRLATHSAQASGADVALVIADGLCARAIEDNALPLLEVLVPALRSQGLQIATPCLVRQARVALGDEVGEQLGARQVVVLIGERPGLSSPNSMGIYFTHAPCVGLTDESRNCISNVRPEGLHAAEAAHRLLTLMLEARRLGYSGVQLKDESLPLATPSAPALPAGPAR